MKVTQKELRNAIDAHSQSMNSAKSAANPNERARELEWVKRTGSELMAVLERPMRATVPADLVRLGESMVDQSAAMIARHEFGV